MGKSPVSMALWNSKLLVCHRVTVPTSPPTMHQTVQLRLCLNFHLSHSSHRTWGNHTRSPGGAPWPAKLLSNIELASCALTGSTTKKSREQTIFEMAVSEPSVAPNHGHLHRETGLKPGPIHMSSAAMPVMTGFKSMGYTTMGSFLST